MKTFASTQLFILTDIAKQAILADLSMRIEGLKYVKKDATTDALKAGFEAERQELLKQFDYYSGTPESHRTEKIKRKLEDLNNICVSSVGSAEVRAGSSIYPHVNSICGLCNCPTYDHCKSKTTHAQGGI